MAAMSGRRRIFIDEGPGETRAVVTLDGQPEHLIIEREGEPDRPRLGETWRGRVGAAAPGFRGYFVDLGAGPAALMAATAGGRPTQGAAITVEVTAEARADKGPLVKALGPAEGPPGRVTRAATLEARLREIAPDAPISYDAPARDAADIAEEMALADVHMMPGGLSLAIERTRGLVAVDVDFASSEAGKRAIQEANRRAVREAARLIRLKGWGGPVVIDLIGKAPDHAEILAQAKLAFAADQPGVVMAGVSRLGMLELALPWRRTPVAERLLDPRGEPTARTVAQRLCRALAEEGRNDPGGQFVARCAPEVAAELEPLVRELGPRFSLMAEVGRARGDTDIRLR